MIPVGYWNNHETNWHAISSRRYVFALQKEIYLENSTYFARSNPIFHSSYFVSFTMMPNLRLAAYLPLLQPPHSSAHHPRQALGKEDRMSRKPNPKRRSRSKPPIATLKHAYAGLSTKGRTSGELLAPDQGGSRDRKEFGKWYAPVFIGRTVHMIQCGFRSRLYLGG